MDIIDLDVTLQDVEPAVTRQLQVPLALSLHQVHLTLQAAMGWQNAHLYMFQAGDLRWGMPDMDFGADDLPADKTTLGQAIAETGTQTLLYVYDFGDSWEHVLRLGQARPGMPGEVYPLLVEAMGRCPPEDVGGFPGFEMFLDAIADPKHPEHKDLKAWYGGPFDPRDPDAARLRKAVSTLARAWTS